MSIEEPTRLSSQLGGSGNIVGVTFNDLDGDGIFDTQEPVIPGVTVYLDQNNNGIQDPNELLNISRSDGVYNFLGLVDGQYSVRQIPPNGTVSTTPEPVSVNIVGGSMVRESRIALGSGIGGPGPEPIPNPGTISGVKFNDFNQDGFRDPAEPGLPGFTIYIDQNNNNQLDPDEPTSITGESGEFAFTGLSPNATYTIREIQQPGFIQTTPDTIFAILSPDSSSVSGVALGNATTGPGTGNISGVYFGDLNINGVRDFDEPIIPNGQVFLDANRNGIFDGGEASTFTDEFGFYSFSEVTPGLYNVDVIRDLDEARTTSNPVIIFTGVEEEPENAVVDIGTVFPAGTGNVEGVKYLDINANGILDPDEPGIPNFTIYADLNSNHILDVDEPFAITDTNGVYFLPNLPATRLTIREAEEQGGFSLTTPSQTVDVPSGEILRGVNFGNAQGNTIAGVNFLDNNANGAIDPGDVGLPNSTVYLDLNGNGIFDPEEPFRITNDEGQYSFNTLPPDTYVVEVVPQPGFTQTTPDPVIIVTSDEAADFVNIGSTPATPVLQGDLIGTKFNDLNSNGNLDPGETGLANFTLYLDVNGNNVLDPTEPAAISSASGNFSFNNPPTGTYFLREVPQPGFVKTTPDQQITLNAPISVLQGDQPLVFNVGNAQISPPGPEGPEGSEPTPEATPAPEPTPELTPEAAQNDSATNGETTEASRVASQVTGTSSISGVKFSDNNGNNAAEPDEPALPGFTIYLDINENGVLDSNEPTSITDLEGRYGFTNLSPATYVVREVQQAGFTKITPDPVITLVGGDTADFVNIGNQPTGGIPPSPTPPPTSIVDTSSTGAIVGVKFDDRNADGQAGPDEPRLIGVELFVDLNNNGLPEANEPVTLTDTHGEYRFTLPPGNFRVRETPPAGFVNTTPTPVVPVVPGQTVIYNFGDTSRFDPNTSISGIIFTDSNNSGIQDGGEAGIPTAQVFLDLDGDGTLDTSEDLNADGVLNEGEDLDGDGVLDIDEPETFTDPDGRYVFNGLTPGNYTVGAVLEENLFFTTTPPIVSVSLSPIPVDPTLSPSPINVIFGQNITDIDLGVNVQGLEEDTVSGIVFNDLNANGLYEPLKGETGIPGVEVYLDSHRDGKLQGFEPNQISGPGGTYGLDVSDVAPGQYPLSQVVRTGFTQTTPPALVSVGDGSSSVYNFGNRPQTLITGTVFEDFNGNGIQDFNDTNANGILDPTEFVERGVPGFQIYADINQNGILDNADIEPNTFTDTAGEYAIVGLKPGTYTLRLIPQVENFTSTTPTDLTITVDEFENSNLVFDFAQSPVVPPTGFANVSGIAFDDTNGDGLADPGEPQLPNVTIYVDANENGERDNGEQFAVTDQFGRYDILNLFEGNYIIRQEPKPGFTDSTTPAPVVITLAAGDNADFVNFANDPTGLPKAVLPEVSISGIAFNDINGNGLIDNIPPGEDGTPGFVETGIPGVTVFLDRNDNLILDNEERTAITDSLGVYDFDNLPPGTYSIRQVPPPGLFQTNQDPTLTLFAGDDANFVNFGNSNNPPTVPPPVTPPTLPPTGTGNIGGVTFEDLNGDGFLDPGEPGIGGVVVYFDQNNNTVRDADELSVVSDINGNYGFSNLADATYTVRQDLNPDQAAIFSQSTTDPLFINSGDNLSTANIGNISL
ncbi:MAG: SdrD B-like domain-containing protein [Microcoleaceae cyanobacterium]